MTSFRTPLILCFCTVLLVTVIAAGCTTPTPPGTTPVPTVLPTPSPTEVTQAVTCQFTSCHGLDLSCGVSEPRMCTMEYALGDRCRQYARCVSNGGTCTLATDPAFASCKDCVEQCSIRAGADSISAYDCESKC